MKLKKLLLPFIALTMLLSGCGRDHMVMFTQYYEIHSDEWTGNDNMGYAYCERSCPSITPGVIQEGAVLAYYIDDNGFDNPLPYLLPYYEVDENGNTIGPFFENLRYDISDGKITFILQQNDCTPMPPQGKCTFKVCIMENRR